MFIPQVYAVALAIHDSQHDLLGKLAQYPKGHGKLAIRTFLLGLCLGSAALFHTGRADAGAHRCGEP